MTDDDPNLAQEFAKSVRDAFVSLDATATKRDIANLYAAITLAVDSISALRADLSYDPRTDEGKKATARYKASMGALLNAVRDGLADIVPGVTNNGE